MHRPWTKKDMKTFSKPSSSLSQENGEETTNKAATLSNDVTKLLNHIKQHMENLNAAKALTVKIYRFVIVLLTLF